MNTVTRLINVQDLDDACGFLSRMHLKASQHGETELRKQLFNAYLLLVDLRASQGQGLTFVNPGELCE